MESARHVFPVCTAESPGCFPNGLPLATVSDSIGLGPIAAGTRGRRPALLPSRCVLRKVARSVHFTGCRRRTLPQRRTRGTDRRPVYVDSCRGYGVSANICQNGVRCRPSRPEGKRLPPTRGTVEFLFVPLRGLVFPDVAGATVTLR